MINDNFYEIFYTRFGHLLYSLNRETGNIAFGVYKNISQGNFRAKVNFRRKTRAVMV